MVSCVPVILENSFPCVLCLCVLCAVCFACVCVLCALPVCVCFACVCVLCLCVCALPVCVCVHVCVCMCTSVVCRLHSCLHWCVCLSGLVARAYCSVTHVVSSGDCGGSDCEGEKGQSWCIQESYPSRKQHCSRSPYPSLYRCSHSAPCDTTE